MIKLVQIPGKKNPVVKSTQGPAAILKENHEKVEVTEKPKLSEF